MPEFCEIFALYLLKTSVLLQSWRAAIVLLGVANGCYLWKKNTFLLVEVNSFFFSLCSHLPILCVGFSGDFDTKDVLCVAFKPHARVCMLGVGAVLYRSLQEEEMVSCLLWDVGQ